MTDQARGLPPAAAPRAVAPEEARLRKAAQELEGLFVQQLLKAMRETVPRDGVVDGGTGEEIFTGLLDQHLSTQVGSGWERGLGAALYRQLQSRIPDASATNGAEG
jgi:peptidoglycan hydrolase FlgJ